MSFLQKIKNKLEFEKIKYLKRISKKTPKEEQFFFSDPWNLEVNMVETVNYFAKNSDKPVFYAVPDHLVDSAKNIINSKATIISDRNKKQFQKEFIKSKYCFTAHWKYPRYFIDSQKIINLWHGIPYKSIGNYKIPKTGGIFADLTLGTSPLTCKIFSKAFNVPLKSVINIGYPRNDILIRENKEKHRLKEKIKGNLNGFKKIIIWLPTLRKDVVAGHATHGKAVNNVFQVEDFNVTKFNKVLNLHEILCIVKPHPFSVQDGLPENLSNIYFINDQWLWTQKITLYHILACSDVLISDVSSIIIDYLLIDKPVICLSADFEQYKKDRGFVFENMEEWMPTQILKTQEEFFKSLNIVLETGQDEFSAKRKFLRDQFFTHQDDKSAQRLFEYICQKN